MNHSMNEVEQEGAMSLQIPLHFVSLEENTPSRQAWLAYCYHIFSEDYSIQALQEEAHQKYSKAISSLYRTNLDGNPDTIMEILVSAIAMHSYEIVACTDAGDSCLTHQIGMLRFVESLGPDVFQNPVRLRLFEYIRWTLFVTVVLTGTRTDLVNDLWNSIPWSGIGLDQKSTDQQLIDILFHLPDLIHKANELAASDVNVHDHGAHTEEFNRRTAALLVQLQQWYRLFSSRVQLVCWRPCHDNFSRTTFPNGYPIFRSSVHSIILSWYYTALTTIFASTLKLHLLGLSGDRFSTHLNNGLDVLLDQDTSQRNNMAMGFGQNLRMSELSVDQGLEVEATLRFTIEQTAYDACTVILPLLYEDMGRWVLPHTYCALLVTMNTCGGSALAEWATKTYFSTKVPRAIQDRFVSSVDGVAMGPC